MSYFGVSLRNGVGLGLGTVPSLTNTPLGYRLAPSLDLSFAGSDTLDPRITFSRTTNATLTNSAGLIANAPMNLLTFSEQFDNAVWVKNNLAVTANSVVAPNGTTTADTITAAASAASGKNFAQSTTLTGQSVFSVYAKQGTHQFIQFFANSGTFGQVNFDLLNGTLSATTATGSITAVGNGWYRCTAVFAPSITLAYVAMVTSLAAVRAETWTSVGTETVQLWGAQLELGSTATTYNPTTVKNLLGFTENFDNAAWTKSNAFVQTNNLRWSEDFTNSLWIKGGTATASTPSTLNFPAVNDIVSQEVTMTATVGTAATFSVVLSGTGTVYLGAYRSGGGAYEQTRIQITLTTTPTRYSVTHTMVNSGNTGFGAFIARSTDGTATTLTATQAQLVNGTSAGDYKATYAAAAAVGYTDIYGQPFAQKLVENTAAATQHLINNSYATAGTSQTLSIYAKAAERTQFAIQLGTNASFFDLSAGTVISGPGNIQSIGNGWYRCSLSGTPTNANTLFYLGVGGSATYTGDGTSGIYIFGAQLADSASVDPYVYQPVAAPSSVAYYGPRFDYDPVTLAPKGLLIEEQRTNLLLNSAVLNTQVVTTTATAHTLSFYGTGTIVLSGASTGTVVGTGAYPTRTTLTFTPIVGVLTVTVTGSVTMAQLEAGAFATSYIPTVASQVTRAADSASMIGNNFARWYNVNEGTVFAGYTPTQTSNTPTIYGHSTSDTSGPSLGSGASFQHWNGSTVLGPTANGGGLNTAGKSVLAYTGTASRAIGLNAGTVVTSATTVGVFNTIRFGATATASPAQFLNGTIARFAYYNRRLSNTELQGITS